MCVNSPFSSYMPVWLLSANMKPSLCVAVWDIYRFARLLMSETPASVQKLNYFALACVFACCLVSSILLGVHVAESDPN